VDGFSFQQLLSATSAAAEHLTEDYVTKMTNRDWKRSRGEIIIFPTTMNSNNDTIILWRPVGPKELQLIRQTGMKAFPARLAEQPIFYPVLSEEYATKIARDWNVPADGAGFVTRFRVKRSFLRQYSVKEAGGRSHLEYCIPAEDMNAFNAAIVGPIEVVRSFP
jgi:hypothetical protein